MYLWLRMFFKFIEFSKTINKEILMCLVKRAEHPIFDNCSMICKIREFKNENKMTAKNLSKVELVDNCYELKNPHKEKEINETNKLNETNEPNNSSHKVDSNDDKDWENDWDKIMGELKTTE